jgi:hypothetical protein
VIPTEIRRPHVRLTAASLLAVLVTGVALAAVGSATAQEAGAEPPDAIYTVLGRGYAVVLGYPADEVPSSGGDDEGDAAPPPPAQTCPPGERGVSEELAERLEQLQEADDREPVAPSENDVPTPRGQPIKFTFGIADTSLRSDPGSHAIASFFYVDLGGGQDPWTSTEADGYASGHAREEERCGQPYFGQPGSASNVHVISRATDGPYAFAFNQTQRPVLPGGVTFRESITVAEMDGQAAPISATVTTVVTGVSVGPLHADEVVTVLDYATDGTEEGTTISAVTDVAGLEVGGQPLALDPGAPPVSVGDLLVGIAAPELRQLPDGGTELTAGGLYVAGELQNPLGLQSKQAAFIGGAWLDASTASFPTFDSGFPGGRGATPQPPPEPIAEEPLAFDTSPVTPDLPGGDLTDDAFAPIVDAAPGDGGAVAEPAAAPAATLAATSRLGIYLAPMHLTGPLLILSSFLAATWFGTFVWARQRYPEIRAALATPPLRWLDTAYRAFLRG